MLSNHPQTIDKNNWYYEYRGHIKLIHMVYDDDGNYIQTDQIKIPWKRLSRSEKRRKQNADRG